jgi:hypothetical protein
MDITLQYFDGCPNWEITDRHLRALIANGVEASIHYEEVANHEIAVQLGFRGSPTVLIDGVDPFAVTDEPLGLACRIYQTEAGPAGSPSVDQLLQVMRGKRS